MNYILYIILVDKEDFKSFKTTNICIATRMHKLVLHLNALLSLTNLYKTFVKKQKYKTLQIFPCNEHQTSRDMNY